MTVKVWHLLLPVCLVVGFFNWGAAVLLWLIGWWASYIVFGGLRVPILNDYGVEPSPRYRREDDDESES